MGAPIKTAVEAYTDLLAAFVQEHLDAYRNEYAAKSVLHLFDQVDSSGDPDVETTLGTAALNVDSSSLPAATRTQLTRIFQRSELSTFVTSLNSLVRSAAGGSHADMRAYLSSISAKLHPLAGELFRSVLGQSCFTASSVVAGVSNPFYGAAFPLKVYQGADGSLADETADAISATAADVTLFTADDHSLYIGYDHPFTGLCAALSTLSSADITATFQYWNGSAWTTLAVTDNTAGFTASDIITWTAPADWSRWYKDAGGTAFPSQNARLYYIRITRTENTVVTPPVGTCLTIIPSPVLWTAGGTDHAGISQPPLAICRVTGTDTIVVTAPAAIDHTRWAHPIGTESKLRLRALTPISADVTLTLAYVDQDGANGSTVQSAWSSIDALDTFTLALTSTDGLRSVRTTTSATTTAVAGVFVAEADVIRAPAV